MPETVNQRIKKALKRGDMARLATFLNMSHQNVTQKINSEKEIDSVDFIIAVSKITNRPFEYFKPAVYEVLEGAGREEVSMVKEDPVPFGKEQAFIKRLNELEKRVDFLESKVKE